jgi:hypothetical protein
MSKPLLLLSISTTALALGVVVPIPTLSWERSNWGKANEKTASSNRGKFFFIIEG